MDLNRKRIARLIFMDFTGEISESDKKNLEKWKSLSPQNLDHFNRIASPSNIKDRLKFDKALNEERAWKAVELKMSRQRSRRNAHRILFRFAAACILLVSAMLAFHVYEDSKYVSIAQADPIFPSYQDIEILHKSAVDPNRLSRNPNAHLPAVPPLPDTLSITVPKGNTYNMKLSDGSEVYLNSKSKIEVPVSNDTSGRKVIPVYGTAYFKVKHNPADTFVVKCNNQVISVIGTSFNVETTPEYTRTTLEEGRINITFNGAVYALDPGDQSVAYKDSISITRGIDTKEVTSWKNNLMIFQNKPLDRIMDELADAYDLNVEFDSQELKKIRFTGELNRQDPVNLFLAKIEYMNKVKFSIYERTIKISQY